MSSLHSTFTRHATVAALLAVTGCETARPAPCVGNSCGTLMDPDVLTRFPDLPEVATDVPAPEDRSLPDAPDAAVAMDAPMEVATDAPTDDVPRDPPVIQSRTDLGTRGIIASLPCSDVLRYLQVRVTPRTVPPNSFQLQVTNASPVDTLSIWYDASLNTQWNIESLSPDLRPGQSVTLDFWNVAGSPAWYVLGINRLDHYYVNRDGVFVEFPCGRAARSATQQFRATIPP